MNVLRDASCSPSDSSPDNPATTCPLCDTPLTVTVNDVTLHFTAHTPDICRLRTLDRIKTLTRLFRDANLETAEQQRIKCEYGRYASRLEGLLREHNVTIPHEHWHHEDMERAKTQKYYASLLYEGDL